MILEEKQAVKQNLKKKLGLSRILGCSKAVEKLRKRIETISSCDVSVLISGECGTGKELAARAIHYLSSRDCNPFVPVNCGAIPENLFENELFGHRKGAFTDAIFHQEGLIKEAQGGTLFLDEIGVITPYTQVKLLRLLQDKEYKPLGDPRTRKADIRIIAATNMELQQMVEQSEFREDLFFRLNIVSLSIPPLRERKEDIPILAEHFLRKYSAQHSKSLKKVAKGAMTAMISYSWPGNIRELENKIQHAVVMTGSEQITLSDLHLNVEKPKTNKYTQDKRDIIDYESFKAAKQRAIDEFEKNYLIHLMTEYHGDVVSAAQKAGKSRTALWNLLTKHHIHPSQFIPAGK
jgi:two-component system response regulator GlrR